MRGGAVRGLLVLGGLALAFVLLTQAVGAGVLDRLDLRVDSALEPLRTPGAMLAGRAFAALGGIELTALVAAGLAIHLWRTGFHRGALALAAFPLAVLAEIAYKRLIEHPAPGGGRLDAPSIVSLLPGAGGPHNSYPSGHMVRTVLVYGLLAFVIVRLAPPGRARRLVYPLAAVMIAAMALDRLLLGVHWLSDVAGGMLLGAVALVAATTWLDRPDPVP